MSTAKEILEKIRHVKVVDLRFGYIEVLSSVAINDYRFPQSARTCLSVEVPTIMCSIRVLVGLLESSLNLESPAIETSDNFGRELMLTLARILLNKTPALEKMVFHNMRFTSSSPQLAIQR
ncbi:hypothetical protein CASFOL_035418 [Castilleja foliolosa]|uniref:Uncharacterized protein n=1 Tax=Castilleja foliolosa TaxID=1961234 RepID=A0ABD3BTR8_9LAMI